MKTRLSGWKTRLQVISLAAFCCVALGSGFSAMAQETAAPVETQPAAATVEEAAADTASPVAAGPAATDPAAVPAETTPAETEAAAPAVAEAAAAEEAPAPSISKPDTVWVLMSAALVIFMTLPGLAL
ncbi:MAG: hypothetical protein ABWY01_10240, partial [Pseudoxanthomonas sp.]